MAWFENRPHRPSWSFHVPIRIPPLLCPGTTQDYPWACKERQGNMTRREGAFYFLTSIRSTGRAQPDEYKATAEREGMANGSSTRYCLWAPESGAKVGMTFIGK